MLPRNALIGNLVARKTPVYWLFRHWHTVSRGIKGRKLINQRSDQNFFVQRCTSVTLLLALFLAMNGAAFGQSVTSPDPHRSTVQRFANSHEFAFARLIYRGVDLGGWGPRWQVDWPEAETHLLAGLSRFTRIDTNPQGALLQLTDNTLFDHPWLYAVEVGSLSLNNQEAARLQEYLLRGGFLMVDDFHGPSQWDNFVYAMKLVFPNRRIEDLAIDDAIFNTLFDIESRSQIPGLRPLREGRTWERGGNTPHWRGIRDDDGRIMVAINFNMDLGDAWEHADWPQYPQHYSSLAYRFAVNYVLYSMTH